MNINKALDDVCGEGTADILTILFGLVEGDKTPQGDILKDLFDDWQELTKEDLHMECKETVRIYTEMLAFMGYWEDARKEYIARFEDHQEEQSQRFREDNQ